jgi:hypothetical protein
MRAAAPPQMGRIPAAASTVPISERPIAGGEVPHPQLLGLAPAVGGQHAEEGGGTLANRPNTLKAKSTPTVTMSPEDLLTPARNPAVDCRLRTLMGGSTLVLPREHR